MEAIVSKAQGHDSLVIVSRNNPDSAAVMLRSEVQTLNEEGFLQVSKRVGLFKGNTADIRALIEKYNLREGDNFSAKVFPVRLVVRESSEPEYVGHSPKINPTTGEVVTSGGKEVYRSIKVVPENSQLQDNIMLLDRAPAETSVLETASTEFDKQGTK